MNVADFVVIAVMAVFAIIGISRGFVRTVLKIGSFFVSVFIAIRFHPSLADFLKDKPLYGKLKDVILSRILTRNAEIQVESATQAENATQGIIDGLSLPEFIKGMLIKDSSTGILDYTKIAESVSEELAGFVISLLSLVLLFIVARIVLMIAGLMLAGLTKLPVIKQIDKAGGLILGAFEGFLMIYVILALLMLFGSSDWFAPIHNQISGSLIAGYLYENNILVKYITS